MAALVASAEDRSSGKPPEWKPGDALAWYAPKIVYPTSLQAAHIGGTGVFLLYVDLATGIVSSVTLETSTGSPILDRTCIDTFKKWRFRRHIASKVKIPVTFRDGRVMY